MQLQTGLNYHAFKMSSRLLVAASVSGYITKLSSMKVLSRFLTYLPNLPVKYVYKFK